MNQSSISRLAAAGLLFASSFAVAHEDDEIEEIIVYGRWEQPAGLNVSASQGFVSQEEMDSRPRLRAGDLLEFVPGLVVTQHSGSGKSNQMFLRGFNLDHGTDFATYIDGMPINMPTHGHGQGYTDLNFLIPEMIANLEFRKGPYYADIADFSSAGAAYFATPRTLNGRTVKAGFGENGFSQVLYADGTETSRGDLWFAVQGNGYDGPWVGVSEDLEKYSGIVRYTESTPEEGEWGITVMAYDAQWDSADQVPARAVASGLVSRLGTIDDTVGGATSRHSLSGRWHRDFGAQQITARGYAIDYELDLYSNFTYFLNDPERGDQFQQVDDRMIYGGDLTWRSQQSDSLIHKAGLNIRYDDIAEVGLFNTRRRQRFGTVRQDAVDELTVGAFYTLEQTWGENWRSSIGVRADWFDFDVRSQTLAENSGNASDFIVSPKLNLIRKLSESSEAYLSAGFGYHSNDARGTVTTRDPVTLEPASPVDPLVRSKGAEVGWRFLSEDRLNVSAALWVLELDSELLFVGDAGNTEPSGASRRYGVEIPAYYRISDRWMLDTELAFTKSAFTENREEGDEIPGSLSRVATAGIIGNFDNGAYGTLRVRHFGDRPLIEDGSVRSGSSTIWNLGLGYKYSNFDFRFEVLNLFDAENDDIAYFYESRLPGEPINGFEDIHFHPFEPRMVRAYVTWTVGD